METTNKKFNWLFDDMNQDLLIHLSCRLNAHYDRFCTNDFYAPVAYRFKEQFVKWSTYFKKVQAGDIYFASEEEINAEIIRLTEAVTFAEQDGLTGDEADYLCGPQWADCDGEESDEKITIRSLAYSKTKTNLFSHIFSLKFMRHVCIEEHKVFPS
jgi:hypothetical protein